MESPAGASKRKGKKPVKAMSDKTEKMDNEFCALQWLEHSRIFSHAIGNLRGKAEYTDATLACDGRFFPVHKFVLSTCSHYFNSIFEWTPCVNPVVVINNVESQELEALLDFMYIGEASIKEDQFDGVMRAAECLSIQGLAMSDDDRGKRQLPTKDEPPRKKKRRPPRSPVKKTQSPSRMPPPGSSKLNTHALNASRSTAASKQPAKASTASGLSHSHLSHPQTRPSKNHTSQKTTLQSQPVKSQSSHIPFSQPAKIQSPMMPSLLSQSTKTQSPMIPSSQANLSQSPSQIAKIHSTLIPTSQSQPTRIQPSLIPTSQTQSAKIHSLITSSQAHPSQSPSPVPLISQGVSTLGMSSIVVTYQGNPPVSQDNTILQGSLSQSTLCQSPTIQETSSLCQTFKVEPNQDLSSSQLLSHTNTVLRLPSPHPPHISPPSPMPQDHTTHQVSSQPPTLVMTNHYDDQTMDILQSSPPQLSINESPLEIKLEPPVLHPIEGAILVNINEDRKPEDLDPPPDQSTECPEEIPDLLNSLVHMRPLYDPKAAQGPGEIATFHSVEPHDNMYEFSDEIPAVASSSQSEIHFQRGQSASISFTKISSVVPKRKPPKEAPKQSFLCLVCNMTFPKRDRLNRHMRTHQTKSCTICNFQTNIYKELQAHKRQVHKLEPLKCKFCTFKAKRMDTLRRHLLSHAEYISPPIVQYTCKHCDYIGRTRTELRNHMKATHNSK